MKNDQDGNGAVSQAERARWVERYRASGLGLQRFADEHGLKPGRLHYWVYAPGLASPRETVTTVFQEVRLSGNMAGSSGWAAELLLPSGLTVRLREGAAPEWARALLATLDGFCSR